MVQYGNFPGIQVNTESGGITSIAIGEEEKLVLFGEANYDSSNNVEPDDSSLDISAGEPEQINARREADEKFGEGSELAEAMREALSDGGNIDFLYGVAVPRESITGETFSGSSSDTGSLENVEIVEDVDTISNDGSLEFEFRYGSDLASNPPTSENRVHLNPLTGEYAVTTGTVTTAGNTIDYTYSDYNSAFTSSSVRNVVSENESGIYLALCESDDVSTDLRDEVSSLRTDFQMVNGIMVAEPNDSEVLATDPGGSDFVSTRAGADARYDASTYSTANQSVSDEFMFKFAPGRLENVPKTIGGGLGGLFAGNPISNPIYNDEIGSYDILEQQISRSGEDDLRSEDVIPVRSGGTVRVVGNRSTNFSASTTVAADFWTRRITDRVILIGKEVGDNILGRINDEDTRSDAENQISAEMRGLVGDRLIKSNGGGETNWTVDVYESSTNDDQVNIDISFTPYGIVKRINETITVDTN